MLVRTYIALKVHLTCENKFNFEFLCDKNLNLFLIVDLPTSKTFCFISAFGYKWLFEYIFFLLLFWYLFCLNKIERNRFIELLNSFNTFKSTI